MRFDPRWLTAPVDRRAVRAHADALRRRGVADPGLPGLVLASVVLGIMAMLLVTGVSAALGIAMGPVGPLIWIIAVAGIVYGCVALPRAALRRGRETRFRLAQFAAANGMEYVPGDVDPALPGLIFHQGSSRQASHRVRGTTPRFVEFANYRYVTGSGKSRQTHNWGYVAIHLDAPLPNIVLDAKGNNGVFGSNLPAFFDKQQRLGLEGSFNEFFDLYCPQGYEPDALYLFTPDIMARLMDTAAQLDVEIVDDWLFLYARRSFSTLDPQMWAWLFSVVAALIDKIQRWERWRDERLALPADRPHAVPAQGHPLPFAADAGAQPAPPLLPHRPKGVALPGRRLRRTVPWWMVVVLVVVFGGVAFAFVAPLLALL